MLSPFAERLIVRETFGDIVKLMTAEELGVAWLRLGAVPDEKIAQLLDIRKQSVGERMARARERIVSEIPEMAHFFRDRTLQPGPRCDLAIPLEQGWVCSEPVALRDYHPLSPLYSPAQVAAWCGMSIAGPGASMVRRWCRAGQLPGAHKRGARWMIPEEGLEEARKAAARARWGRRRGSRAGQERL